VVLATPGAGEPGRTSGRRAFYAAVARATMVGTLLNFSPINPIKPLYWSAVGIVAVPVIAIMMMMTGNRKVMGRFVITGPLRAIDWLAVAVMAAAVVGMAITASANRAHDMSVHLRHSVSHWGSLKANRADPTVYQAGKPGIRPPLN